MPQTTSLSRESSPAATRRWVVPALLAVIALALAARVTAFLWLPNIDGDAYCYLDKARELRAAFLAGHLRVQDLFFFWLPLYPLVVALASLIVPGGGHLMIVGKIVSAASGLAACWLTYRLALALTRRPLFALAGALAVAVDPWQLLYSSNTMTELPFEALVLGALDRLNARRWTAASLLLVVAGFIRVEAWPLAGLVPCAAFVMERRIRVAPVLLTFAAPAAWLAISYAAQGSPLAFFAIRNAYVAEYLAHYPTQAHLTWTGVQGDWSNFRHGASLPVLLGAGAAVGRLVIGFFRRRREPLREWFGAAATATVFLFMLTFLLAAYVTHAQPAIFVRYGLIYLSLGVCLTLWWLAGGVGPRTRWTAAALFGTGFLVHWASEARIVSDTRSHLLFQRQAAELLAALKPRRVFCDSIVVRVEAGFTPENSCDSHGLRQDPKGFLEDLRERNVDYLVYINAEASTPVKLFPSLADFRPAFGLEPFRKIDSPDWRPPVLIYRVTPGTE